MHICTRLDVEMFDPAAGYSKLQIAALARGLQIYHDLWARSIRRRTYLSKYALFWHTSRSELSGL